MRTSLLFAGIVIFFIVGLFSLGVQKSLAYGSCDYSEGSYGIDCDELAPTGSVLINNGNSTTSSRTVTLKISATDDSGTVSQMMISESSSFSGASWESYAASKSFTLSSDFGMKTIYIKFKDAVGNVSSTYFDKIEYVSTGIGGPIEEEVPPEEDIAEPEVPEEPTDRNVYYKLQITDKDGNPLEGAMVTISELNIQAVIDENGFINLGFIEKGDYEIVVEYGGETYTQVLELGGDSTTALLEIDIGGGSFWKTFLVVCGVLSLILIGVVAGYKLLKDKALREKAPKRNQSTYTNTPKISNISKARVLH